MGECLEWEGEGAEFWEYRGGMFVRGIFERLNQEGIFKKRRRGEVKGKGK